ncbi:ABC-three component system middle component 2 [Bifidobacterium margollesii]|uniref:ABC-three component system middle component 2 n=1 Tax=Bifidobacterium margollesii TaxID=2020964 RepID=UPI001054D5D3|nr:ABC-three component system middle component 2 [Bifidobacterium margollesii]
MVDSILDTPEETGLRVLLLLRVLDSPASCDYLAALDTLVVNARTLKVASVDLNGTHRLAAGEISRRIVLVRQSLKPLTLKGLVSCDGFEFSLYTLTLEGIRVADAMTSVFAKKLVSLTRGILKRLGKSEEKELIAYIASCSTEGVR